MPLYRYETTIKEHHLDTFGHVNNAVYLALFEEARWQFITDNGYGLKEIMKTQKGPVVLKANVKFRRELKIRDRITIESEVFPFVHRTGKVRQVVRNSAGKDCAIAEFLIAFFDLKERKIIPPTPEWTKAVGF